MQLRFQDQEFSWKFLLADVAFPILDVGFLRFHKLLIDPEGHALHGQAARQSGKAQPVHSDSGGQLCAAVRARPGYLTTGPHRWASQCRTSLRRTSQSQTSQRRTSFLFPRRGTGQQAGPRTGKGGLQPPAGGVPDYGLHIKAVTAGQP